MSGDEHDNGAKVVAPNPSKKGVDKIPRRCNEETSNTGGSLHLELSNKCFPVWDERYFRINAEPILQITFDVVITTRA